MRAISCPVIGNNEKSPQNYFGETKGVNVAVCL